MSIYIIYYQLKITDDWSIFLGGVIVHGWIAKNIILKVGYKDDNPSRRILQVMGRHVALVCLIKHCKRHDEFATIRWKLFHIVILSQIFWSPPLLDHSIFVVHYRKWWLHNVIEIGTKNHLYVTVTHHIIHTCRMSSWPAKKKFQLWHVSETSVIGSCLVYSDISTEKNAKYVHFDVSKSKLYSSQISHSLIHSNDLYATSSSSSFVLLLTLPLNLQIWL